MSAGTPSPVVATVFTIGGRHCSGLYSCSDRFDSIAETSRSAPSRSDLYTTNTSAISMMPALSACTSSPVPGTSVTIERSAVRTISTSSWPTPTVSMMTTSFPDASRTSAASPVARARPPRCPRVAMLRMKTPSSPACDCMRRRSPSTAPPVNGLVGSTARMPTTGAACPDRVESPAEPDAWRSSVVKRSTSVLLPAPGGPVTPTRQARPVCAKSARTRSAPAAPSSSTSEMPRAMARASPATIRSANEPLVSIGWLVVGPWSLVLGAWSVLGPRSVPGPRCADRPGDRWLSLDRAPRTTDGPGTKYEVLGTSSRQHLPGDHETLNFAGAFADGRQLDVPKELLGRIVFHEPVAAVDLHAVVGRLHGDLARIQLRHRRLERHTLAAVLHPGGSIRQEARRLDARRVVGQFPLDRLKPVDRPAERFSLSCVAQRRFVRTLRQADGERRDADPPGIEHL